MILEKCSQCATRRCAVCAATGYIEMHHLIPVSQGGPDDLVVPLCGACHGRVHAMRPRNKPINHGELVRAGLDRARANGVRLGGRRRNYERAAVVRIKKAQARLNAIAPIIADIEASGKTTLTEITRELIARNVPVFRSAKTWHIGTVAHLMKKLKKMKTERPDEKDNNEYRSPSSAAG